MYVVLGNGSKSAGPDELIRLSLEIEQSKLNRENSLLMLDKSLLMYFAFLIVGIVGFINKYIDVRYLNFIILLSFCVLASGLIPYMITMDKEVKRLNGLLGENRKKQLNMKKTGRRASGMRGC